MFCNLLGRREYLTKISETKTVNRRRHPPVPDERPVLESHVPALEAAIRGFAQRKTDVVVNPVEGLSFDSIAEAYEFYNLHSWEVGFGIRLGRSRQNVSGSKCMQEIVCGCSVSCSNHGSVFFHTVRCNYWM